MTAIFDRYPVIDVDTHVSEPPDVWTSRVSSKWGDLVPHVERMGKKDMWMIGDKPVMPTGITAMAGFDGLIPQFPDTLADAAPAAYDAKARLAHMDAEGIHAQVIYPNVGGFGSGGFLKLGKPELMVECVRAYNDFLSEWCGTDPKRLIPIMALPFWDVPASLKELERCAALGHKGVLFGSQPQAFDQPHLVDRPDLIFGGVCHRFPKLDFVSVESGVAWLTFALEAFDWQWRNSGVTSEHPEYDLLPSEYFARQIYACFWFEEEAARRAIESHPDNILYETDFPHPTSMSPGPQSIADSPRDYAERVLSTLPEESIGKVVHHNAARLYGLD
jgi:predicted TIM-barrel fold metal-dependent hydrolase